MATTLNYTDREYVQGQGASFFKLHFVSPVGAPPDGRNDIYVILTETDLDAIAALPAGQRQAKFVSMVVRRLGYAINGESQIDTALMANGGVYVI